MDVSAAPAISPVRRRCFRRINDHKPPAGRDYLKRRRGASRSETRGAMPIFANRLDVVHEVSDIDRVGLASYPQLASTVTLRGQGSHDCLERSRWLREQVGGAEADEYIRCARRDPSDVPVRRNDNAYWVAPRSNVACNRARGMLGSNVLIEYPEKPGPTAWPFGRHVYPAAVRRYGDTDRSWTEERLADRDMRRVESAAHGAFHVEHAHLGAVFIGNEEISVVDGKRGLDLTRGSVLE